MKVRALLGFTLLEMLVVIAIIAVLAVFTVGVLSDSTAQSRDAERQSDIRSLQTAIELYRQENGRYPEGCNGANNWSGEPGSDYECSSDGPYIIGLAPKYIRTLPTDPKPNGTDSGYVYRVDGAGTVYKLVVFKTVEVEKVVVSGQVTSQLASLKFCDVDGINDAKQLCLAVYPSNNTPTHCQRNSLEYQTSYAVWGGYDTTLYSSLGDLRRERYTENITCSSPN